MLEKKHLKIFIIFLIKDYINISVEQFNQQLLQLQDNQQSFQLLDNENLLIIKINKLTKKFNKICTYYNNYHDNFALYHFILEYEKNIVSEVLTSFENLQKKVININNQISDYDIQKKNHINNLANKIICYINSLNTQKEILEKKDNNLANKIICNINSLNKEKEILEEKEFYQIWHYYNNYYDKSLLFYFTFEYEKNILSKVITSLENLRKKVININNQISYYDIQKKNYINDLVNKIIDKINFLNKEKENLEEKEFNNKMNSFFEDDMFIKNETSYDKQIKRFVQNQNYNNRTEFLTQGTYTPENLIKDKKMKILIEDLEKEEFNNRMNMLIEDETVKSLFD